MRLHIFHLEGDPKPWVVAIQNFEHPNPASGNQVLIAFETIELAKSFKDNFMKIWRAES